MSPLGNDQDQAAFQAAETFLRTIESHFATFTGTAAQYLEDVERLYDDAQAHAPYASAQFVNQIALLHVERTEDPDTLAVVLDTDRRNFENAAELAQRATLALPSDADLSPDAPVLPAIRQTRDNPRLTLEQAYLDELKVLLAERGLPMINDGALPDAPAAMRTDKPRTARKKANAPFFPDNDADNFEFIRDLY